jgi:predicted anti-sigma-YlaC factor YlaD
MQCSDFEELLSDYIEGTLPLPQTREMAVHLAACPECRTLYDDLSGILSNTHQLVEEVPFFLRNRLTYIPESIEVEDKEPVFYMKWVAAMIATIILFFNLFYFTNIYPQANRTLHGLVSGIERIAVETEAIFSRFKSGQEASGAPISITKNEGETVETAPQEHLTNG